MLILNDKRFTEKKSALNKKNTKVIWRYYYPIEDSIKKKFTSLDTSSYVLGVFDCCRSSHSVIGQFSEIKKADTESKITKRGEGEISGQRALNFTFIQGCPANEVVKDKNPLVEAIGSELRAAL